MKRIFATVFFSIVLLVGATPASAEIIDRIVARVNNQIVTLHDVRQAAIPYLLQQNMSPDVLQDRTRRQKIYRDVLKDLVDRKLLVQEAEKLELKIGDDELDQWLAFTRQQQNMTEDQFRQVIQQYGMKYETYREMVRQNLLKIRMVKIKVGSQVSISEKDVDQIYRERFGGASGQERFIEVSHILIRPENDSPQAHQAAQQKAKQALQRIEKGEAFAEVAKVTSEGPAADKGGHLGTFRRGELDPDFEKAAFALEVGETSDVVQTKFGYHVIHVSNEELQESPDIEERKDMIRGELQQKEMERMLEQYLGTLRNRAFVDVKY